MKWEYRVVDDNDYLSIYEVYWERNKISAWSAEPIAVGGDCLKELKYDMKLQKEALKKPILKVINGKLSGR